jgi:hypothetical protein
MYNKYPIMNFLKSIFIFFKDLRIVKKNNLIKNSETTYQLMRYFYIISDGLLLNLISKYFDANTKSPSKFKKGYKRINSINVNNGNDICNELFKMSLINDEVKNEKIKLNKEKDIDFSYYKKKSLVRLDINPQDLLNNKKISEFILKKLFVDEVKNILGTTPYVVGVNAWITLPAPVLMSNYDDIKKYVSSQLWHRDCDKLRDIKIMTYLTDVEQDNEGQFEYVENSHFFNFFNPFRYNSSMRLKDDYVQQKYKKKIKPLFGKSGTSFIVDTRGIHRGKTINKKNHFRAMLEIYFSNHQFGKNKSYKKPMKNCQSYELWKNELEKNKNYQFLFNH